MKTATKVFLILGMIPGLISVPFGRINVTIKGEIPPEVLSVVKLIWFAICAVGFIISLVFGITAFVKVNKAKCKKDVPVWLSVCVLIFVNIIPGILMLCLKDEHLMPKELAEFKKLLDDGIITQEEYDAKAAKLLNTNV